MSVPSRTRGMRQIRAARAPVSREILLPAQSIIHNEVVSGATLLLAAVAALVWANSPWREAYHAFQNLPIAVTVGDYEIRESLHHWINDGLMAVFFFVVGLEIKRELVRGELAEWKRAAFPAAAALGGMVLPASLYAGFNIGGEGLRGWGIPMATDIAFALGVLALLGRRIPQQLRIFLLALAIADDIGAILVIALFYTGTLSVAALLVAAVLFGLVALMIRAGVRNPFVYLLVAVLFWVAVFESGVHATIAGVLLGVIAPCGRWFSRGRVVEAAADQLEPVKEALARGENDDADQRLGRMEEMIRETEAPLDRLERIVHPWVSILVLPVFALINAGVNFSDEMLRAALSSPVSVGVAAALLFGKPLGILGAAWTAVRLRIATMPEGLTWRHIAGVGTLAGIGFTVALFITELAFRDSGLVEQAKVGILAASACAGLAGYLALRFFEGGGNDHGEE